jgi:hypothetical protein
MPLRRRLDLAQRFEFRLSSRQIRASLAVPPGAPIKKLGKSADARVNVV